jgi:DNA-binding beta-propeller fold protein YncE
MVGPPLDPGGNRALARWRTLAVGATVATLLLAVALAWQIARPAVRSPDHAHSRASIRSDGTRGFHDPVAIADDGIHVWVANEGGGAHDFPSSVTELNARDGSWVQTLYDGEEQFGGAQAIAADGVHVLVAGNTGALTELTISTGRWVQLGEGKYIGSDSIQQAIALDGGYIWVAVAGGRSPVSEIDGSGWARTFGSHGTLNEPSAIAVAGQWIWVASLYSGRGGSSALTELNAWDGSWALTVSGGMGADPVAIYALGGDIWVANRYGGAGDRGSVAELDTSNGRWVRTLSGGSYRFNSPVAMTADNTDVWVVNGGSGSRDGSVTELDASDGHWVRTLSGGSYGVDYPSAIAADGTHVWVTNVGNDSVTELNASDGSWVQTVHW